MPVERPVALPGDPVPSDFSFSFSYSFDMDDDIVDDDMDDDGGSSSLPFDHVACL